MKNETNKSVVIELSNGQEVELNETWVVDDYDSYPEVDIWDCETNRQISSFIGSLPDIEDEDFDMNKFVKFVEEAICL